METQTEHVLPPSCSFYVRDDVPFHVALRGLCSINGSEDFPCEAFEVGIDHMSVKCGQVVAFADKVIFALPQVGLVEAVVARIFDGGFETHFDAVVDSKLGLFVSWLQTSRAAEMRLCERIVPVKKLVRLIRRTEPECFARIIDLSRSGVAFTTSKTLREGDRVIIGAYSGRVVRLLDGGAAVRFDEPIGHERFDPMIEL